MNDRSDNTPKGWDQLAAGVGCPFDPPRVDPNEYWESIAELSVSTLCLMVNQAYRGHCILIYEPEHVTRVDQLDSREWLAFTSDLYVASRALVEVCRPDHINLNCQGNVIPHLHWHIVPRYKSDPRWGSPHTMTSMEEMARATLDGAERGRLKEAIRERVATLRGAVVR